MTRTKPKQPAPPAFVQVELTKPRNEANGGVLAGEANDKVSTAMAACGWRPGIFDFRFQWDNTSKRWSYGDSLNVRNKDAVHVDLGKEGSWIVGLAKGGRGTIRPANEAPETPAFPWPIQQPVNVKMDDTTVERMCRTFWPEWATLEDSEQQQRRARMRAALYAAYTP